MIGATLDDHIASLQVYLIFVHQHVDLTAENNGIIDGVGFVHARVSSRQPCVALDDGAGGFEHFLPGRVGIVEVVAFRREFDDAKYGTMRCWRNADVLVTAVSVTRIVHRHGIGNPEQAVTES